MARMSSRSRLSRTLSLVTTLTGFCLTLLAGQSAHAGAYTYGTTPQRTVNAGILLIDGNPRSNLITPTAKGPDNLDPYVFYVLSQRTDIVPFGWSIVNPIAPGSVTSQMKLRWDNRAGTTANTPLYQLGQSVTPGMAGYWEVPLTQTSADDLAKFDVLLLDVENDFSLTAADYEKLRRFVEGGGTLWIEDSFSPASTGGGIVLNFGYNAGEAATLFGSLQFQGNSANGTNFATVSNFSRSPLITTPYSLSENELNTLGYNHIGNYYSSNIGAGDTPTLLTKLSSVISNGTSGRPVIASGQYGAGQVVVTCTGSANTINDYAGGVDVYGGGHPNSGPFSGTAVSLAPTQDLKLVTDILASADGHQNEHQNTHQTGVSTSGLPAIAKSWSDNALLNPGAGLTAAIAYGHIGFAVRGTVLYAYDLYPSEDLDGNGDPDDGVIPTARDFDKGLPYDLLWQVTVGANASAPTVAQVSINGVTTPVVFVQGADGTIRGFNATVLGGAAPAPANSFGTTAGASYTALNIPAPAPTVFENRVYTGRADGTLYMRDFGPAGTEGVVTVDRNLTTDNAKAIVASPTVGIVPDSQGDNDIVALCTTGNGLYSVFLGSRGEALQHFGNGYNTKLAALNQALMDVSDPNVTTPLAYSVPGTPGSTPVTQTISANATASGGNRNFTGYTNTDPLYANYNADLAGSGSSPTNLGPLTRTIVGAAQDVTNSANLTGPAGSSPSYISAPALDRTGNVYYTVTFTASDGTLDSALVSVHDAPSGSDVRINWRFLLPKAGGSTTITDADNANYTALTGYRFTTTANGITTPSAPVVDGQGNVYVLATNGGSTAVLCFNGTGTVSADIGDANAQQSGVSITQPINGGASEFGDANVPTINSSQYIVNTGGHITFNSFGQESNAGSGTHVLYPNLNEPYPLTINYSTAIQNAGNPTAVTGLVVPLHTNLTWYTLLDGLSNVAFANGKTADRPGAQAASGLIKAGSALYFVETTGRLDSVTSDPQTITNKYVEAAIDPNATNSTAAAAVFSRGPDAGVGATTAVPSAGNGVLLVNGLTGTAAFTNQVTLVVDSNRVLEMDSNGDAEWAVDATTKTTLAGDITPIYNTDPNTGKLGTGQFVTTTLELNRPSSLTELTQNDYLVADTGNNRCVRFDRAGKVIWELTKFTDPNGIMKVGEPDTINQPTSVQIRTETDGNNNTIVRYLISDTGNFRILEICDVYDKNFQLISNHVLNWVSHTHDIQNRDYRYQSAAYYVVTDTTGTKYYVAALITNKRLAALPSDNATTGNLAPANQDGEGGSIALLDYYPQTFRILSYTGPLPVPTNGYITAGISSINVPLDANGRFDPAQTAQKLYLRNPRYLKAYVPQGASVTSPKNLLVADDNGVFDLDGTTQIARFGFTQANYRTDFPNTVGNGSGLSFSRVALPFIPASIQLLGNDFTSGSLVGRYLITNSFSQGEAANDVNKVGGEVFEVDFGQQLTGGYNNHTLSRPTNTSPLSQPTFAYRLQ